MNKGYRLYGSFVVIFLAIMSVRCATEESKPLPALPEVPEYVRVPHPRGEDLSAVRAIFHSPSSPDSSELKRCDETFRQLEKKTPSQTELRAGSIELVKKNPTQYHWCFYHKMLSLEERLKETDLQKKRQNTVIETYSFLVPVAQAFKQEYQDSRYIRWAIQQYKDISEWVFYRRVTLSPEATKDLVQATKDPFGVWQKPEESSEESILEKYGIRPKESDAKAASTSGQEGNRKPAGLKDFPKASQENGGEKK